FRVRNAGGEYRSLLVRETPFERDGAGEVTETLSIATDVTALVAAESRALASEREAAERVRVLEAILESAGEGIVVADATRGITTAPAAAPRLLGGPLESPARGTVPSTSPRDRGYFQADGETPFPADQLPLDRALRGEATDDLRMVMKNAA